MSEGYGSIEGMRPGNTTGKENYEVFQERRKMEALEHTDEKATIRKYLAFGSVLAVLASLALYTLWGRVSAQMQSIAGEKAHIKAGSNARAGEGGGVGGESSERRVLIKHLLQKPAIEQAQTHTWGQIETWAKHHPTKPVHDGMVKILEEDPSRYKSLVTDKVISDLADVQKCDASNVCGANPIAAFIRSRACPPDRPCPSGVASEIERLARWAAKIAVDGAFQGLKDQLKAKPVNPFHSQEPQNHPMQSPSLPYSVPASSSSQPYRAAANAGLGYPVPTVGPTGH